MSHASAAALSIGHAPRSQVAVLVVDDHEVIGWGYRLALSRVPWVTRCVTARSGAEARDLASRYSFGVAIVDVFLGREAGTDLARELSARMRVLLLSIDGRVSPAALASSRALGVVGKSWPMQRVIDTVQLAAGGRALTRARWTTDTQGLLSDREIEIVELMATGATNPEIAEQLGLSPWTVKQHTSSAYRKLNVRNRAEAVIRAQECSLIGPSVLP